MPARPAAPRLSAIVVAVVLAGTLALQRPPDARASHSESSAQSTGTAGCMSWVQDAPCQDWSTEKPEGGHAWIFADEASYSGGGSTLLTRQSYDLEEEYTPSGTWRSVTLSGSMTASNSGGGKSGNSADYDISLEAPGPQVSVRGTISAVAEGSEYVVGSTSASILIECGDVEYTFEQEVDAGASEPNSASKSGAPLATVDSNGESCDVEFDASVSATTNQPAAGNAGSVRLTFELTFSTDVAEGCEGIEGVVTDGPADMHENPLGGIRVQLFRDGSPRGPAVATADDGFYCLPGDEATPPGDYQLRATLVDQRHEPPLFETRYHLDTNALFVEVPVEADDFAGGSQVPIAFVDSLRPWVSDVANVHYQSARFVGWLTDTLGWSPAAIGPFIVRTHDDGGTRYRRSEKIVFISLADSAFEDRDQAHDVAPENGEWHEIGHHVGYALGVGSATAPACQDRINHGGWLNTTTCDSVIEGFPTFLATLASIDLDAGLPGYANSVYAGFQDLEAQNMFPWSAIPHAGGWVQREDMAVAALLWDLADDTPTESGAVVVAPPAGNPVSVRDEIAIGGSELIDLLSALQVNTVEDLYRAAVGSPHVPASASAPSIDLDGDDVPDASALDAVFLMHGFYPVEDPSLPAFRVGDAFPRTDHVPDGLAGLVPRPNVERVPGSYVRLRNGTTEQVSFSIEVAGEEGGEPFRLTESVPANATDLLYLEVPPYYRSILAPGDTLPACDAEGLSTRAITISAPGMDPRTLDTCEYTHAVVAATDGAALTVTVGPGPYGADAATPMPSAGPAGPTSAAGEALPLLVLVVGGLVAVLALLGLVGIGRRRGREPSPGA